MLGSVLRILDTMERMLDSLIERFGESTRTRRCGEPIKTIEGWKDIGIGAMFSVIRVACVRSTALPLVGTRSGTDFPSMYVCMYEIAKRQSGN